MKNLISMRIEDMISINTGINILIIILEEEDIKIIEEIIINSKEIMNIMETIEKIMETGKNDKNK